MGHIFVVDEIKWFGLTFLFFCSCICFMILTLLAQHTPIVKTPPHLQCSSFHHFLPSLFPLCLTLSRPQKLIYGCSVHPLPPRGLREGGGSETVERLSRVKSDFFQHMQGCPPWWDFFLFSALEAIRCIPRMFFFSPPTTVKQKQRPSRDGTLPASH